MARTSFLMTSTLHDLARPSVIVWNFPQSSAEMSDSVPDVASTSTEENNLLDTENPSPMPFFMEDPPPASPLPPVSPLLRTPSPVNVTRSVLDAVLSSNEDVNSICNELSVCSASFLTTGTPESSGDGRRSILKKDASPQLENIRNSVPEVVTVDDSPLNQAFNADNSACIDLTQDELDDEIIALPPEPLDPLVIQSRTHSRLRVSEPPRAATPPLDSPSLPNAPSPGNYRESIIPQNDVIPVVDLTRVPAPGPIRLRDREVNHSTGSAFKPVGTSMRMRPYERPAVGVASTAPSTSHQSGMFDKLLAAAKFVTGWNNEERSNQTPQPASPAPAPSGTVQAISCPICFDDYKTITELGRLFKVTKCGHIFCNTCIEDAFRAQKKCPTCRKKLVKSSINPIYF